VLVFTRTKFGANNVAEFLEKNDITAMALHGNKSQTARTQALAGFKSGDVRALVATDIAARGIDIDDLPHVVNYEIPNVSEDYVHRIGRTGRAGADGAAINLVCLDEEGFMRDIERFTKQDIEVKLIEGFGPEPGEKAEPLAMGRQTIWGGVGKPPSRDVMQAAAKAARTEMLQRVREKKVTQGDRGNSGGPSRSGNSRNGPGAQAPRSQGARPPQGQSRSGNGEPRQNAPRSGQGQPDPMRTSVDMMAERGRRGGNGGGNRNGGSSRSGGYGGGSGGGTNRGSGNPRGPFSR
jgi:ATP-dependent RNA helicase RhlE